MTKPIVYNATKTSALFHESDDYIRLLSGPEGSGKSVTAMIEIFRRAAEQEAAEDGIRYSRWAIVRNTYPMLVSTTLKTWREWFPETEYGKIRHDFPITHRIRKGDIDLEVIFIALDGDAAIDKLMSLELTGIYFNELQFISQNVFNRAMTRINRYPAKKSGVKITFSGIIADTNPPDTRHWIYRVFEEDKPKNHSIFKYEPGVIRIPEPIPGIRCEQSLGGNWYMNNPNADYISNLPDDGYYLNAIPGKADSEIKVFFQGEYGTVRAGKPVYTEYNDELHHSKSVIYMPNVELCLGWDYGRTPCVVIAQLTARGRLNILDEITSESTDLKQFVKIVVIPHLNKHYPNWRENYTSVGDPAGASPGQTDEKSCQQVLADMGIKTVPARTNNLTPRFAAVSGFLTAMIDGRPALAVSEKAFLVRKGFLGEYHFKEIKAGLEKVYKEEPEKNACSHPHDALQYIALKYSYSFEADKQSFNDWFIPPIQL